MRIYFAMIGGSLIMMMLATVKLAGGGSDRATERLQAKAEALAASAIIVDGHIDVPYRLGRRMEDISGETSGGDFDFVRARRGGLDAPFMSIYIPAEYQSKGGAKAFADRLIDMVYGFQERWPEHFAVAVSVADVRRNAEKGLVSLPMGMENGAPIEGDPANLVHFYERGIRYITLTHSKSNHICDSSYDTERPWNGLSPFGEKVVAEMNRLGIMIDVSHVSDSAFYDVIRLSEAPLIASHSSCRVFTPGWERNMDDDMIRLLAEKGGVICINFGSSFLRSDYAESWTIGNKEINSYLKEQGIDRESDAGIDYYEHYRKAHPYGTVDDVLDHIDHVVKLAGVDHVGFGSDFDGVLSLPEGLQDVSQYPNLIRGLLQRGYSESDIHKIAGGNFLRVWETIEKTAQSRGARK